MTDSGARGLTQQDAFFVAYQEASDVSMQLGGDIELEGELRPEALEAAVAHLVARWPHLGQKVHRRALGLAWQGQVDAAGMVTAGAGAPSLEDWRNTAIDPFREPPLQLRWIPRAGGGTLALRGHHAALDGQSLLTVAGVVLRSLAGGDPETPPRVAPIPRPMNLWRAFRRGRLGPMWRYMGWLKRESRRDRSARLVVRETAPGDVGAHSRRVEGAAYDRLRARARSLGVQLPWLCCAAWMRAIGAWNAERGGDNPWISLEVPVSTRHSKPPGDDELGNGISPLVLQASADRPLGDVARDLRQQFVAGVRQGSHLAVPLLTAGGRYLPWWLFRRMADDTTFSGFATSHFTWMRAPIDPRVEIGRLSGGRLEVSSHEVYGPVCLHMGAAVMVVEMPSALQLSMTHRLNALPADDARRLADLLMAQLLPEAGAATQEKETR